METKDEYLARSFKSLAHPKRAAIFRLLADDPSNGSSYLTLQALTGLTDATLTHHLREMERCGLIRRQRTGPTVAYRLTPTDLMRCAGLAQGLALRSGRLSLVASR